MRHILLPIFLLFFVLGAQAQPLNRATYATMLRIAEEKYEEKDYYRAIEWYEKVYEESDEEEIALKLGQLNYLVRDYASAERWYKRILRRDKKNEFIEHRFTFGRILKMREKYEEAIEQLQRYIEEGSDETKKELAKMEIEGAEFARIAPPIEGVTISNAGREINSRYSEYSAYLTPEGDQMYFSGFGTDELIILDGKEEEDENIYARIFSSSKTDEGWGEPAALDQQINRPGFHSSNVNLSPDGDRMYFTRQLLSGNVLGESKIYVSYGKGNSWGPAQELVGVNGNYIAKHPAVGELFGNEVLFFVSDMDGGYGGLDIYYATYKGDGVYGDPVNLGPKINTVGDEVTPFYRDGVLYFSSDGHPGLGGQDIFSSAWDGTRWSNPANMGKGYNTSLDEKYFMLDREGYVGFLISNREGTRSVRSRTCCDDIYNVSLKIITADLIVGVYDKESKQALSGATVELIELTEGEPKVLETKTNEEGHGFEFPLELDKAYRIIATRSDFFPDTAEFHTVGLLDSKTFEEFLQLEPAPVYREFTREEPIVLENIYYDFDDDKILESAEDDLELVMELLDEYPDMVIEMSSHTDNRGDDAYNRNLSQRRAESARKWLLERGVERNRVKAVGYGETEPFTVTAKLAEEHDFLNEGDVLTEEFIDALETEEQKEIAHQINRRTEFRIISGPTSIRIEEKRLIRRGTEELEEAPIIEKEKMPVKDEKKN